MLPYPFCQAFFDLHDKISAVDGDNGAAEVIACMRCEEDAGALHVVSGAPAVCRDSLCQFIITLLRELRVVGVGERHVHLGVHIAGCQGVDVDAILQKIIAEGFCQLGLEQIFCVLQVGLRVCFYCFQLRKFFIQDFDYALLFFEGWNGTWYFFKFLKRNTSD